MTSIFYFIGFLIFIMLFPATISYPNIIKIRRKYNVTNDVESKLDSIIRKEDIPYYLFMMTYAFSILSFISWTAIGLLTNNWLSFLCIILSYFITSKLISYVGGEKSINIVKTSLHMILSLLISISCLFMSINHFYFKYDLEPIIKSFFNF